jgi:hypothetical protein
MSLANQLNAVLALADMENYLKDMAPGFVILLEMNLKEQNPRDWDPWVKEKLMASNPSYWKSILTQ